MPKFYAPAEPTRQTLDIPGEYIVTLQAVECRKSLKSGKEFVVWTYEYAGEEYQHIAMENPAYPVLYARPLWEWALATLQTRDAVAAGKAKDDLKELATKAEQRLAAARPGTPPDVLKKMAKVEADHEVARYQEGVVNRLLDSGPELMGLQLKLTVRVGSKGFVERHWGVAPKLEPPLPF